MRLLALILVVALAAASPAFAKNDRGGSHKGKPGHDGGTSLSITDSGIRFKDDDLTLIFNWFRNDHARADYSSLPPGIQKRLARGKGLPPGIAKRYLPSGLEKRLSAVPRGYERIIVGDDLLLVELSTGTISDIVRNIFR